MRVNPRLFRSVKSEADYLVLLQSCACYETRLLKAIQVYRKSGQICDQLGISFLDHLPSDLFSRSDANKTSLLQGIPLLRHCETALGVTPQRLAIANVPPKQSMISVVFM